MTTTVKRLSSEQANALKQQIGPRLTITKNWQAAVFADAVDFATFLNIDPAQGAGEAFATDRADGQIDGFFFL